MADDFDFEAFQAEILAWAEGVDQETRSAFAFNASARALVEIGGSPRSMADTGSSFDIALCRAILTSAAASKLPTADVLHAANSAADSAQSGARSALFAADSAYSAARSTHSAAHSARSARSAARSARSAALSARATRSATDLLDTAGIDALFAAPLWLDVGMPEVVQAQWEALRTDWSTSPAMAFWTDWYEGLLVGRTPDWDLWEQIVLIDDEVWNSGEEAVAAAIEGIQEKLREERAKPFEDHARSLLSRASALSKQADQLSKCIEEALNKINEELGFPNQTPDSLEPLYKVPQILRSISLELTSTNSDDMRVKELAKLSQALIWTVNDLNERLKRANNIMPKHVKKRWHESNAWSGVATNTITALLTSAVTIFAGSSGDTYNIDLHVLNDSGICLESIEMEPPKPLAPKGSSKEPPENIPEHKRRQV
ncbi:hypothetical protein [Celeribacter sp.]|uniref:hypothetical protein n=1 Tax=Celeribacter sp. TaxID=1890673 RepID=UPI003A925FC9